MSDQDQEEETEFIEDVGDEETNEQAGEEESEASDSNSEVVEVEADAALEKYEVVYDQSIDKVSFPVDVVDEVQSMWDAFLHHAGSPEAAGEIILMPGGRQLHPSMLILSHLGPSCSFASCKELVLWSQPWETLRS